MRQPVSATARGLDSHPRVGVLSLQGDFARHLEAIERAGGTPVEVSDQQTLESVDALIMPGGESTTMFWLLERFGLLEPLRKFVATKPVWGTCAGLILLSREIEITNSDSVIKVQPLGVIDVKVNRNGFGRQIASFEENIHVTDGETSFDTPACFIRAPRIVRVGNGVEVLATFNGEPVLVRQGHVLGSCFHSELHDNPVMTRHFIDRMVRPTLHANSDAQRTSSVA